MEIVAEGWRERIVGLVEEWMLEVSFGGGVEIKGAAEWKSTPGSKIWVGERRPGMLARTR